MIQDLKMGTLSWIIWAGAKCDHIHSYMETEGELGHPKEKGIWRQSKELSEVSDRIGYKQAPEFGRGKKLILF